MEFLSVVHAIMIPADSRRDKALAPDAAGPQLRTRHGLPCRSVPPRQLESAPWVQHGLCVGSRMEWAMPPFRVPLLPLVPRRPLRTAPNGSRVFPRGLVARSAPMPAFRRAASSGSARCGGDQVHPGALVEARMRANDGHRMTMAESNLTLRWSRMEPDQPDTVMRNFGHAVAGSSFAGAGAVMCASAFRASAPLALRRAGR